MTASNQHTDRAVIEASLKARGLWNADGINRRARARLCRQCRWPVMVGLDGDPLGWPAAVDPMPLTPMGEATVLLHDGVTFSLRWINGHYEIDVRFAMHITAHPAGTESNVDIVAEHICGVAWPANLHNPLMDRRPVKGAMNDSPPF